MFDRLNRYMVKDFNYGAAAESISYGMATAEDVVM
jgi:hypothetical protein